MTNVQIELDLNLDLTNTWTGSTDYTSRYKLVVKAEVKEDNQDAVNAVGEFRHKCSVMNWSNMIHASGIGGGHWSQATWINRGSSFETLHSLVDRHGGVYKVERVIDGLYEIIDVPICHGYIISDMYQQNIFGLRDMLIELMRTTLGETHRAMCIGLTDVEAGVTITSCVDE